MEYSSKQVDPLMERDEVLSNVGVHQAQWRLLRKRYSIRMEFEQTGSLGMYYTRIPYTYTQKFLPGENFHQFCKCLLRAKIFFFSVNF